LSAALDDTSRQAGDRLRLKAEMLAAARTRFAARFLLNSTKFKTIKEAEQSAIEQTKDELTVLEAEYFMAKVDYEQSARRSDGALPGQEPGEAQAVQD